MNFTIFQESAFLQSLGWAIANSIWQGGILWVLYHILVSSYNNVTSKFKNNLSTFLLFTIFIWFVITFLNKYIYFGVHIIQTNAKASIIAQVIPSQSNFRFSNFLSSLVIALPYLSVAYLFLLVVFFIKIINSYRYTSFIKSNGLQKPNAEWILFIEKISESVCINKSITIWLSEYVDVPATIGFLKPVILIPLASLNQLSANQLEAIILHEFSHIKRNDYLVNLFVSSIETILFFNPFIALLVKIIERERENCCDDFVLQYQYDRHSYATALLSLEKYRNQNFHLALTATSGKKQLLSRIKRIMNRREKSANINYGQKLLALLLVTGFIISIGWLSPAKQPDQNRVQIKLLKKINAGASAKLTIDTNSGNNKLNNILPGKVKQFKLGPNFPPSSVLSDGSPKGKKETFLSFDDQPFSPQKFIDSNIQESKHKKPIIDFSDVCNFENEAEPFNANLKLQSLWQNWNFDWNKLKVQLENSVALSSINLESIPRAVLKKNATKVLNIKISESKIRFGNQQLEDEIMNLIRLKKSKVENCLDDSNLWRQAFEINDYEVNGDFIHQNKIFSENNEPQVQVGRDFFSPAPYHQNISKKKPSIKNGKKDQLRNQSIQIDYSDGTVVINHTSIGLSKLNSVGKTAPKLLIITFGKQLAQLVPKNISIVD